MCHSSKLGGWLRLPLKRTALILMPCFPGLILTEISGSSPCEDADDGLGEVVLDDDANVTPELLSATAPVGRREGALGRFFADVLLLARADVLASGCLPFPPLILRIAA